MSRLCDEITVPRSRPKPPRPRRCVIDWRKHPRTDAQRTTVTRARQDRLLGLLARDGEWMTAATLADGLGVTPRSIRSYVTAINARVSDGVAVESGPAGLPCRCGGVDRPANDSGSGCRDPARPPAHARARAAGFRRRHRRVRDRRQPARQHRDPRCRPGTRARAARRHRTHAGALRIAGAAARDRDGPAATAQPARSRRDGCRLVRPRGAAPHAGRGIGRRARVRPLQDRARRRTRRARLLRERVRNLGCRDAHRDRRGPGLEPSRPGADGG